jgi:hypothetical protein
MAAISPMVPGASAQSAADALFFAERPPAAGPRLMGMGGASIGGVGEVGAFYTNPAGLALADTSSFTGSLRGLFVTDRSTYETFFGPSNNPQSFGASTEDAFRTGYGLGNLGLLYKFPTDRGSLVLGGSLNETRHFGRDLEFANRNQLSSITDFLLPVGDEVNVERYPAGEAPELLEGQFLVEADTNDFVVDFDPDGDGFINRPLSLAAFQTFAIDLAPGLFDPNDPAGSFLPVVEPGTRFRQVGDVTESGALREINLGGAVEAAKGVFVGASANIHVGRYELRDVFEEIDDRNENDGTGRTVDFNNLRLTRRLETDFGGFSARFGLTTQLVPAVRAGLTVETPTWYTLNEESSFRLETVFDDGSSTTYGDDPGEDAGRTEFEYRLRTPWRFGTGLAAELGALRLFGDATFVDWTQMQLDEVDGAGNFDLANDRIEDDFKPVVQTRLGAELALSPLLLRGGFAYHPAPISFAELSGDTFGASPFFGAMEVPERDRTYLSAGIGYEVDAGIRIDLAWMQERFEDRTLPYNTVDASYVNEEVRRNQFRAGIKFSF